MFDSSLKKKQSVMKEIYRIICDEMEDDGTKMNQQQLFCGKKILYSSFN
jgi:hypothetical protein